MISRERGEVGSPRKGYGWRHRKKNGHQRDTTERKHGEKKWGEAAKMECLAGTHKDKRESGGKYNSRWEQKKRKLVLTQGEKEKRRERAAA